MFEDDSTDDSENPYPPGTDGPRVEIPSVNVPSVDVPSVDASTSELGDSKLTSLFVLHVLLWNAVVLLLSLGAMLIHFRGNTATGSQLLAVGVILTAYGLYRLPDGDSE